MYQKVKKNRSDKKSIILLVSLLVLFCAAVGGTIAYLSAVAGPVKNTFTVADISTVIEEETEDGIKSEVKIQNTGTVDAFIRTVVIITWQDEAGNILGERPVMGTDYSIDINTDENEIVENGPIGKWTLAEDGFYYWSHPVSAGNVTGILITSCQQLKTKTVNGTDYSLAVEIIGSGIQADGKTSDGTKYAVEDAWHSNGNGVTDVNEPVDKDDVATLSVNEKTDTTSEGGK